MTHAMLLDVDTGVDDAVAIALASRLDAHELVALTTVAGNVPVDYATANTLTVAAWLGLDVPVYRGMSEPLARPLFDAREHHGYDGLGGWKPDVSRPSIQDVSAPEAMIRLARERAGDITFVCVGPFTNLAVALSLEPRLAEWVDRVVLMGGAFLLRGNTTPAAEFNVYADPEAAALVARSGLNVTWVPLDATYQTRITPEQWQGLASTTVASEVLVREVTRRSLMELERPHFYLHDPLAVAVAESAEIVGTRSGRVVVDVGAFERGRTLLVDSIADEPVAQVALDVNQDPFAALMERIVPTR